jgi:hypothetical protein
MTAWSEFLVAERRLSMRTILALTLVLLTVSGAFADEGLPFPMLGVFFDEDLSLTDYSRVPGSFEMHLVLLNPRLPDGSILTGICGVEGALQFSGFQIVETTWHGSGINGTGDSRNFQTIWPLTTVGPLPLQGERTVLATFRCTAFEAVRTTIELGPMTPSSTPGSPMVLADDQSTLVPCGWVSGVPPTQAGLADRFDSQPWFRPVATILGGSD